MIRQILLPLAIVLFFYGSCLGADEGFESVSGKITESLLTPNEDTPSKQQNREEGWEPIHKGDDTPSSETPAVKTRSIKVLKREEGLEKWETVSAPEKRTGGYVNLKVEFDVNSYSIRSESFKLLQELGKALSDPRLSDRIITINGHTDSDGKEAYNVRLSLNRAAAVKAYLVDHCAISPDRLKIVGYGESMPLKPNTSKQNKQLNRRVEIVAERADAKDSNSSDQ